MKWRKRKKVTGENHVDSAPLDPEGAEPREREGIQQEDAPAFTAGGAEPDAGAQPGPDGQQQEGETTESSPQAECAEQEAGLSQAEKDRDMYKDALVRERADFENYKKRNATLSQQARESGVEAAVSAVLPVLDNFERALATPCSDAAYADGMKMIMRQFESVLEGLGVREIDTGGEFDPAVHHAVMQVDDPGIPSNHVAETLQKGYELGGKVVRPAMVKVAK